MLKEEYLEEEEEELLNNMNNESSIDTVEILQLKTEPKNSFKEYSSKVNWTVFFCICLFTLGSWLDICAIWSELVYLVDELPEGWRLPSILNMISQLAQLGPFIFSIGRCISPKKFTFVRAIYTIFTIGLFSCLFLAFFWKKTAVIYNERRSIYLYIFNFSLSLLDGMSTITFLPYIGAHFSKEYIIPNYIGESLSSLIPGLFAIIQSIGVEDKCPTLNNSTNSSSTVQAAFTYLNYSKTALRTRKTYINRTNEINLSQINLVEEESTDEAPIEKKNIFTLLCLTFAGSFIQYGYLPGLLSYSTIPYGNTFFHLSINLSSVCLPIAIFFSIWSYRVSNRRIIIEFMFTTCFAVYIVVVSALSPCPPFLAYWFGGYLIVISWIMCSCLYLRIRCLIASTLEARGEHTLFIFGCVTIVGQVIGGMLIFLNVDVYPLFKDKPKCSLENFCNF